MESRSALSRRDGIVRDRPIALKAWKDECVNHRGTETQRRKRAERKRRRGRERANKRKPERVGSWLLLLGLIGRADGDGSIVDPLYMR
jgi:hypothetical protein